MRYVLALLLAAGLLVGCDESSATQALLTATPTTDPTATPTTDPTATATPDPTATPTPDPTATPTPDPTATPTSEPTTIPTFTPTPTPGLTKTSDTSSFTSDPSSTAQSPIALKPAGTELAKISSVVPLISKPEKGDRLVQLCDLRGGGRETVHVLAIFALIPEGSQIGTRWVNYGELVGTSYTDPQPHQANAHRVFTGHDIGRGSWRVDILDGSSVLASVEFFVSGYGGPFTDANFHTHIVKEGDTLMSIVRAHWESMEMDGFGDGGYSLKPLMIRQVMEFNDLQSENIYVGQVLRLPFRRHWFPCKAMPLPVPRVL